MKVKKYGSVRVDGDLIYIENWVVEGENLQSFALRHAIWVLVKALFRSFLP